MRGDGGRRRCRGLDGCRDRPQRLAHRRYRGLVADRLGRMVGVHGRRGRRHRPYGHLGHGRRRLLRRRHHLARGRRGLRQVLEVAGFLLFLEGLGLALDVLAEEGVHEEGEVEGGRREVPGEEQGVDRLAHLLDFRVAAAGLAGQRAMEDVGDGLGQRVVVGGGALQARLGQTAGDVVGAATLHEGLAGERLEEQRAHREDVGTRVALAARRLLGRQVGHLVLRHRAGLADPARPVAEVPDAHLALVRHHHAGRRQEAVVVARSGVALAAVRVLQGRAHLAHDEQGVVDGERETFLPAAVEDGLEALPFQELVRDVVERVHLPDAEDLDDVRILELGRELDLIHQALGGVGVGGQAGLEANYGNDFLKAGRAELGRPVLVAKSRDVYLF
jgi:hypothetical protein